MNKRAKKIGTGSVKEEKMKKKGQVGRGTGYWALQTTHKNEE